MITHNTHKKQNLMLPTGYFLFSCSSSFILTCFFVDIILHFPFCLLLYKTHNTNIYAPCGIRTRNPNKRPVAHLSLRAVGHWARSRLQVVNRNIYVCAYIHISKRGFSEFECGYVDWIDLARDRDRWLAPVSTAVTVRVSHNAASFVSR
jgi:hypothetical protein